MYLHDLSFHDEVPELELKSFERKELKQELPLKDLIYMKYLIFIIMQCLM